MTAPAPREVAVVGAGVAGLAAAFRLAAAGHRVRVLERAARAGGRAGVAEWEGRVVDPTAARVTSADAALLGLIREAGLAGELLPLRPWVSAQSADGAGEGAPPVSDDGWLAIARTPGLRVGEALRLVRLPRLLRRYARHLDPLRPERAAPLDDRSLRDFGELYFGPSAVARWMEPWLAERAPVDERDASRVAFLLHRAAEEGASVGALREPPGLLAELLAARVGVRVGQAAARVEGGAAGRLRVQVEGPGAGGPLEVDAVVLAVPAPEARRIAAPLLVGAEHRLLGAVRYDPAIAWIGAAAPLAVSVPTRVRVPRATGAAVSMVAVEPGSVRRAAIGAGRVTAIARAAWSRDRLASADDVLAKELGAAVARWAPGAPEPEPGGLVRRWPEAWPRFDVGAFRLLARLREVLADRRRAGRRLYLAGDWLACPTLEGAASSGLRAAADLLTDL